MSHISFRDDDDVIEITTMGDFLYFCNGTQEVVAPQGPHKQASASLFFWIHGEKNQQWLAHEYIGIIALLSKSTEEKIMEYTQCK